MSGSTAIPQAYAQSIDWIFAQLPGEGSGFVAPRPVSTAPAAPPIPLAEQPGTQAPLRMENEADLRAAQEWLQHERNRLEEYTRSQFDLIRQQHQALMAKHFRSEEALALRSQELNREMQFLASQAEALQQRGRELADWETALSAQMTRLAQAQDELLAIQQTSADVRRDTEVQCRILEAMRTETAQLQASESTARGEFDALQATLQEHQRSWEQKQVEIDARQAQMEQRYRALETSEQAARRRLAELDELEDRLRQELEEQERQLAAERRELEQLRARLTAPLAASVFRR
jgi:DNA repair exonuclease SbcCD ATPase subunit